MRTKVTFLSLLCIVGTFLTTMHAQESCYEQYLQEHDMKILTAEDADDSYDELKKTILAKQMYGDSYVVIADSITQRVKLTKVDGTYIADMHVTLVDSTWYMWLSVDPLAEEYPQISPYSYCMWNPVKFVDPDGRKCTLSVNYQTNTIIVSARYYASSSDSRYAQKAANFWNNQKGLTYTAKDGINYSVQFSLNVYSSKNSKASAALEMDGNTFEVVKSLGYNENGYLITGHVPSQSNCHISVIDSHKETLTSAHEMGHTLMNIPIKDAEHSAIGVMTKTNDPSVRSASVSQETVNNIVESNGFNSNQTLWQKIKTWFE